MTEQQNQIFEKFRNKEFKVGDILDMTSKVLAEGVSDDKLKLPAEIALMVQFILMDVLKRIEEQYDNKEKENEDGTEKD